MVLEEHFLGSKVSTTLMVPFSVSDGCCTREIAVPRTKLQLVLSVGEVFKKVWSLHSRLDREASLLTCQFSVVRTSVISILDRRIRHVRNHKSATKSYPLVAHCYYYLSMF